MTAPTSADRRGVDVTTLVAVIGLVAGYLTALVGYIVLLALGKATGTLDNLVSLSIGAIAGGFVGGGTGYAVGRAVERRRGDPTAEPAEGQEGPSAPVSPLFSPGEPDPLAAIAGAVLASPVPPTYTGPVPPPVEPGP